MWKSLFLTGKTCRRIGNVRANVSKDRNAVVGLIDYSKTTKKETF